MQGGGDLPTTRPRPRRWWGAVSGACLFCLLLCPLGIRFWLRPPSRDRLIRASLKLSWVRTGRPVSEMRTRRPEDKGAWGGRRCAANEEQSWDLNLPLLGIPAPAPCSAKGGGKSEQGLAGVWADPKDTSRALPSPPWVGAQPSRLGGCGGLTPTPKRCPAATIPILSPKLKFIFEERNSLFSCEGRGSRGRRVEGRERCTPARLGSRTRRLGFKFNQREASSG